MNLIFFEVPRYRDNLKPFTLTRPIAEIRLGILSLAEKWEKHLKVEVLNNGYFTDQYLQAKFPLHSAEHSIYINASLCPSPALVEAINQLKEGQLLEKDGELLAICPTSAHTSTLGELRHEVYTEKFAKLTAMVETYEKQSYTEHAFLLTQPWQIFLENGEQIKADYQLIATGRTSANIEDPHTIYYGKPEDIFIEEGVSIRASILNAENGPIYLGKGATIHENAVIKGPFAMLDNSHVNIGSKIREATTIGPHSKLGGEVKNVVVFGNSNKGHEGFLGNSVIGEWCNFGADTNASNLKNNYKPVKIWNYGTHRYEDTGELFCGLLMGDHSKCGINTMFNTGTVVGVFANIFGTGYPEKFIPSFSWGAVTETAPYRIEKALEVARDVLKRRGITLSEEEADILRYIYEHRTHEMQP